MSATKTSMVDACMDPMSFIPMAAADVLQVLAMDPALSQALTRELGQGWQNVLLGSLHEHVLRSGKKWTGAPGGGHYTLGGGILSTATKTLVFVALVGGIIAACLYAEHAMVTHCRAPSKIEKYLYGHKDNSSTYMCLTTSTISLTQRWAIKLITQAHQTFGPIAVAADIGAIGFLEYKYHIIRSLLSNHALRRVSDEIVSELQQEKVRVADLSTPASSDVRKKIQAAVEKRGAVIQDAMEEGVRHGIRSKGGARVIITSKRTAQPVRRTNTVKV